MPTTMEKVKNKITEFDDLYKRMDRSAQLLYPEQFPYKLNLFSSKTPMNPETTISVTSNSPAVFANAIITALMDGVWQTKTEGEISTRASEAVKKFADDILSQIDEYLLDEYGLSSLNSWNAAHVCVRSILIGRYLGIVEEKQFKLKYLPCDVRWTPFELGQWVAPITFRKKDSLVSEYEKVKGADLSVLKGLSETGDNIVTDYWDGEQNEVWIKSGQDYEAGGQLFFRQPHQLGKAPFVIVGVTSGFMLRDKGFLVHEWDDLFQFDRHLYSEHNRNLSIKQTMGMNIIAPRHQRPVKNIDGKPSKAMPKADQAQDVLEGELWQLIPMPDLNRAFISADNEISQEIQMGGISNAELANVDVNRTAVWLAAQARIRATRVKPRVEAMQTFREQLLRLAIDQFIRTSKGNKGDLLIGRSGRKSIHSASKLGDPGKYFLVCAMRTQSKEEEIANIAEAAAARAAGIPQAIIDRDIMMAEDPEEWERLRQLQLAREADPALALFDMARSYADKGNALGDDDEANALLLSSKQLTERGVAIVRQRMTPQLLPENARVPTNEPTKGSALPLTAIAGAAGKGGQGRQAPAQPELI